MTHFLNELNKEQRLAVEATDGPVLVLAGAGSGKTRALTYKIAHLIEKGVDPFNILALTFTNKAAMEMKERVALLLGSSEARNVWLGTFHSVFARILRRESEKLGFPQNFSIYDTDDSKKLIKSIVKDLDLDDKIYKASTVLGRISSAKSNLLTAADYVSNEELRENDIALRRPRLGEIFAIYTEKCRRASAMDFDDLLLFMNILLRDFPDVLYRYQKQFKYILVDEYQDTNFAQYLVVKKLAADNENITVVGDDAQSIYGFRGANIENILNLKKDYPELRTFKLEQNYRSTKVIVNAANSVIVNNKKQFRKDIWTDNDTGSLIKIIKAPSDNEEGRRISSLIIGFMGKDRALTYHDFAILYRTNAQSRALEEALRKDNVPYRIFGSISFYQRKEIKDLIAYFRIVINHHDDEALLRVINYPGRGLGKVTLDRIIVEADSHKVPIWTVINHLHEFNTGINSGARQKMEEFSYMIRSFATFLPTQNAFEMAHMIADKSGILKELWEDKSTEGVNRHENIEELLNGIKLFTEETTLIPGSNEPELKGLPQYVQNVSLLTDADKKENNTDVVSLMTIHMAKGLEFPYVFIAGMEENLFPSLLSLNSRTELEEERRLFYVAVTRAMKQLCISYAETRFKWGNTNFCEPSRFIEEIDPRFLDFDELRKKSNALFRGFGEEKKKEAYVFKTKTPAPEINTGKSLKKITNAPSETSSGKQAQAGSYSVGIRVLHERFGEGTILSLDGQSENSKAIVHFDTAGEKQLLLKYAKLKII